MRRPLSPRETRPGKVRPLALLLAAAILAYGAPAALAQQYSQPHHAAVHLVPLPASATATDPSELRRDGFVQPAVRSYPLLAETPPEYLPPVEPVRRTDRWTLADLEQMAWAHNPSLAEARAMVGAARGDWLQGGLPANPHIGYSGQQLGSGGEAEQNGVYVSQDFIRLRKLRLNRAIATGQIQESEQMYRAQQQRVATDVRIGYYNALTAQRRLEVSENLVGISHQAVRIAQQLRQANEVSRVDLLQARIEMDAAQIQLVRSRNQHQAAWRELTAVVGIPSLAPTPLEGNLNDGFPLLQWDDALLRLWNESPQLAAATAEVERAGWAVERARAEPMPNINVQAILQRDNATQGTNGNLQISLPLPIFNWNQGGIQRAENELVAARRSVERTQLQLQQRLASVFQRYASARNEVEQYSRSILPTASESLELVRRSYEAGEISFLVLLTAQRTFSQTNLAYIESLRELWSTAVEIDGLMLSGSLQPPLPSRESLDRSEMR